MSSNNNLKLLFVGVMVVIVILDKSNNGSLAKPVKVVATLQTSMPIQPLAFIPTTAVTESMPLPVKLMPIRNFYVTDPILIVKAALVKVLDTETDLYQYQSNQRWPLASLTKLMSAVVAIEDVGLDKKIIISESVIAAEGVAGGLQVNEIYSVGELVKAMLAVSSNDAAMAVAEFYGVPQFVNQMQKKTLELGMSQTTFIDSTGLSNFNQGTAEDMEKLMNYIYKKHQSILKTTAQHKINLYEETSGAEKELLNINPLASSRLDFLGGKTGFTDEASGNLISIFNIKNHPVLIIVLGTNDRFGQTELLYNWVKQAFDF